MKRASLLASGPERSSFQQAVSCQLCRTRKLKCDRGRPCFNCSSRDFDCIYASDQSQTSQPPIQTSGTGIGGTHSCGKDYAALSERIKRLEAAIFRADESEVIQRPSTSAKLNVHQDEEQQRTSEWLEDILIDPQGFLAESKPISSARNLQVQPENINVSIILREFPTHNDAEILLDHFIETFDAMYRNLHIPTTWRLLKELYADLAENRLPSATQLAFFLGIFAGSAYVAKSRFELECPTSNRRSPVALAESWHEQAIFLLTKPPVPPSTQALQAFMILTHLCTQIEGFTGNFSILSMSGIQMARVMRIHRLDSLRFREERQKNGADMVDVEIKRRFWWHMVASDWLLSTVGGPNEGTYLFHPSQIETFHPSNVDDEDIPAGITNLTEEHYNLPLSTPTSITYFLCRLQVASLSREVTDLLTPTFCTSPNIEDGDEIYNTVLILDQKYQQLLKSLPPFFQLRNRMDTTAYRILIKQKPYLESQRYLINFVTHTHLARLHRRFLIRGSTQPKFAYSRMQCIQSAETVLEVRNLVIGNQGNGGFTYIFLAHFFMAAVILAMDVCFNPNEVRVLQQKQEVLRACRVLEEELSAKMTPSNVPESDSYSSSHLLLKAFQKAVQNLRRLLRRKTGKEKMQQFETRNSTAEVALGLTSPDSQETNHSEKETTALSERRRRESQQLAANTERYQLHSSNYAHKDEFAMPAEQYQPRQEHTPIPPLPYDEVQGSGQFAVDDLWEEFFTVGPEFNSSDWDTFFIDLDEQMCGMGSSR